MRNLSFDEPPVPADLLLELSRYAGNVTADKYMSGDLFEKLESRIADILAKPSAVWMPSGKLAQMATLRTLADRAKCVRIAMHPRSHFEEYEAKAYSELWGLKSLALGDYDRATEARDLEAIVEEVGAVTIELPLRRLGGLMPSWQELNNISLVAKRRGIYLHLDGARLWESQPYYGRAHSEISHLFDTVYVAFDKGFGGLSGGALVGPTWVIEQTKIWQRRAGGRALRSFPVLLSALQSLDSRLPLMSEFHKKAVEVANCFVKYNEFSISPFPPQANSFNVTFRSRSEDAILAGKVVKDTCGISIFNDLLTCADQNNSSFEVTIRGAGLSIDLEELSRAIQVFHESLFN
ncbi:beta-eliminating lyase-related protein [Labrenzia sp. DG1229]|uniref:threonine aldolase family protein n=1 Tax=Labrenzia sp. DG1229 TaxID=681847 RepID=UPI0006924F19|nr:beta-eliminating lyase-related protein [Labrenzia sp. DG1229]